MPTDHIPFPSPTQPWLKSDLLFLTLSLDSGMSCIEVAGFLGRREDEVRDKARKLGANLPEPPPAKPPD